MPPRYPFRDKDCAAWYAKYPRRVAPKAAERAWEKLSPDERAAALEAVDAFAALWASRPKSELQFCPHPASYLNAGRFYDEIEAPAASWRDTHTDL